MAVIEVVKKLRSSNSCPFTKLCVEEGVHQLTKVFQPDIAMSLKCRKQPTTVAECYEKALHAKFRLGQLKKEKAKVPKTREKKTELTNPKNGKFQTDKVNYARKVFC